MSAPYYEWFKNFIIQERPKTIAEIGIFRAKLTLKVLKSEASKFIDNYWAIDPWRLYSEFSDVYEKKWWPQERWDQLHNSLCEYYPWFPALRVMRLTSLEAAAIFKKADYKFDLVFIDDDHVYGAVKNGIEAWYPLIKEGGILCGHDYCTTGKDKGYYKDNVIRAVDERFGSDIEVVHDIWIHRKS